MRLEMKISEQERHITHKGETIPQNQLIKNFGSENSN